MFFFVGQRSERPFNLYVPQRTFVLMLLHDMELDYMKRRDNFSNGFYRRRWREVSTPARFFLQSNEKLSRVFHYIFYLIEFSKYFLRDLLRYWMEFQENIKFKIYRMSLSFEHLYQQYIFESKNHFLFYHFFPFWSGWKYACCWKSMRIFNFPINFSNDYIMNYCLKDSYSSFEKFFLTQNLNNILYSLSYGYHIP